MSIKTSQFNVVLIGAGFAMFGTPEGPWDISARLEQKLGARLHVDCIIEVDQKRAEVALEAKRQGLTAIPYKDTIILRDIAEWAERVEGGQAESPNAILVATPAMFRGGTSPGRDQELQVHKHFPSIPIFLEKPVATGEPYEQSIKEVKEVATVLGEEHKGVVSVGYFLRYLQAVREMKKIIADNNLTVMATNARYVTAYELAVKGTWWDKSFYQGPIIEQGTHLCDLSRYLAGDVDIDSIHAHALEAYEKPGQLSKTNFDETIIPEDRRIPRATSATWKYESGAVGTFLHATALHGKEYSVELEVYADGYQLILVDPYNSPALHIRRPGSDAVEVHSMTDEDPYYVEISNFIDSDVYALSGTASPQISSLRSTLLTLTDILNTGELPARENELIHANVQIEGGASPHILCDFEDAARTYEMTWKIRSSSEESSARIREKKAKVEPNAA